MSVVAASLAAVAFGAGDFFGGVAARRSSWRVVVPAALGMGLLVLGVADYFFGDASGTASPPMMWCLCAGFGLAIGLSLLYRALAEGRMTEVAPITAIVAIAIPAVVDIVLGKTVTLTLILGLVLACASAALLSGLSGRGSKPRDRSSLLIAIGAGASLAVFYIGLDQISAANAGVHGVLIVRVVAFVSTAVFALGQARSAFQLRSFAWATGAGLFDGAANLLLAQAFIDGGLAETSAIASLYPGSTILLAIAFLGERPSKIQYAGLALAVPAIFLLR
ncbi:MAG: DMT family transporter [Methylobacillus sp.]|jgi:uncharacterized membrane protein|nr:DMT family transporter [Methylobacillus sp.]